MAVPHLLIETLTHVHEVLMRWEQDHQAQQRREAKVLSTVERIVDDVDPSLRMLSGYRKRLSEPVAGALSYIEGLVERIPPALRVDRGHFLKDPLVNAFFVNPRDFQGIFASAPTIREFFDHCGDPNLQECCALMCMHKEERKVLGLELDGELMRREVAQVSVSFSDHQLLSPSVSEQGVREGLKWCMFDGLIANAKQQLMHLHGWADRLKDQDRILWAKLRALQTKANRLESLSRSSIETQREMQEVRHRLDQNHQQQNRLRAASADDYLATLIDMLNHPQTYVAVDEVSMCLNKMGIKIPESSSQPGNRIRFAEVRMANVPPRVVVLVYVPRPELLPQDNVWERAQSYLA
jgi:hypothetical protein